MINVVQDNDMYNITFPYDPDTVEFIKSVPGRMWHPESKMWTIPSARLGFLLSNAKGTIYEHQIKVVSQEDININASIDATHSIPDIDISDVHYRVADGCVPFNHQLDTMKYEKYRFTHGLKSGFLLGDEMGAGKTLQVTNIALYRREQSNYKHCLIICCVNTAKYNWYDDIIYHTNGQEKPYILGSRLKRDKKSLRPDTGNKEKLEDLMTMKMYGQANGEDIPYFIIMNIEGIRMKEKKHPVIEKRLAELVNQGEISMIAIDEIHKNVSMTSMQGKLLLELKKATSNKIEWIPMTGTPIISKPTDVFLPTRLIDAHMSNSYYNWCQRYCMYGGFDGKEIIGYKNIPELKEMLQNNMLRRLKKDILDLPPKLRHTIYVENSSYQDNLYKEVVEDIASQKSEIISSLNPLVKFLKLRQINGSPELVDFTLDVSDPSYLSKNAKLSVCLSLIDDIVSQGEKVVIFSNWVEPLRTLYKFISCRYKVCCYTGTMKSDVREHHKKVFMSNPEYKVMIGTVGALGTSHTLTSASNIIFYDFPWNPAELNQCEDRCHRPGTSKTVHIYSLICKDTIDETVQKILAQKQSTANYIVDNQLDLHNNPDLFDLLIKNSIGG